jgi:hypothetical protein
MNNGPKSMLGIRILVRVDPDLIGQTRILERAIAVRSQLDSELSQNPSYLRTLILHLRMRNSMDRSFKMATFKRKKVVAILVQV